MPAHEPLPTEGAAVDKQKQYIPIPEDTFYLLVGILRLEKDGIRNPPSNIETAMRELKACHSLWLATEHSAPLGMVGAPDAPTGASVGAVSEDYRKKKGGL